MKTASLTLNDPVGYRSCFENIFLHLILPFPNFSSLSPFPCLCPALPRFFISQDFSLHPPLLFPLLLSSFYVSISFLPPRLLFLYYHLYPQLPSLTERLWSPFQTRLPVDLLLFLVSMLWTREPFWDDIKL